jgi:hypothetical protein
VWAARRKEEPVITILLQSAPPAGPAPAPGGAQPEAALETVGLALLAYGLVQLLAKVVDKLLTARAADGTPPPDPAGGFREDDRKRLEKAFQMLTADRERMQRLGESVAAIQEQTRWLSEQRARTDPVDGQPAWNCRARGVLEQLQTQQRLVGQALDELRGLNRQNESMLRKLRAVWRRVSRWRGER